MPSSISSNDSDRGGIDLDIRDEEEILEDEEEPYENDDAEEELEEEPEEYDEQEAQDPDSIYDDSHPQSDNDQDGHGAEEDRDGSDQGQKESESMEVDADSSIPAPKRGRGRPPGVPSKKKEKKDKESGVEGERMAVKSALPASRVTKIIKADKDIPIVAKDAVFLISLATEEFIRRFVGAGQRIANQANRTTVQHPDLFSAVKKIDEFLFLEEMIPHIKFEKTKNAGKAKKNAEKVKSSDPPARGGIQNFLPTTKRTDANESSQVDNGDMVMQDDF